jgi:hypothetical protein
VFAFVDLDTVIPDLAMRGKIKFGGKIVGTFNYNRLAKPSWQLFFFDEHEVIFYKLAREKGITPQEMADHVMGRLVVSK